VQFAEFIEIKHSKRADLGSKQRKKHNYFVNQAKNASPEIVRISVYLLNFL